MTNYVCMKFAKINIHKVASWKCSLILAMTQSVNIHKVTKHQLHAFPYLFYREENGLSSHLIPLRLKEFTHPSTDGWVLGTAVFLLISHFLQLFWGGIKAFSSQPRNVIAPVFPGSAPESSPSGTCREHLTLEAPRRHPSQMPNHLNWLVLMWMRSGSTMNWSFFPYL